MPGRQPKFDTYGSPSMADYKSLSDTKWECKYHVTFTPKCRLRTLYERLWVDYPVLDPGLRPRRRVGGYP